MRLYLCDTPGCQVISFTETDAGASRCPGCGYLGDLLRAVEATPAQHRGLMARLFQRPVAA